MSVEEIIVSSTEELVAKVLAVGLADGPSRILWHRGHPRATYKLVSSLARQVSTPEELFTTERKLLTRFRQRSLPYWPAGYPQNDWEHMFAMQHYGIPTRLLDWSENLFVALYFAAMPQADETSGTAPQPQFLPELEPDSVLDGDGDNVEPESGKESSDETLETAPEEDLRPVIWTLDPEAWNRNLSHLRDFGVGILGTESDELRPYAADQGEQLRKRYKAPLAIYGTHNSARIVAQRGTFTLAGNSLDPLDEFADHGQPVLWKFVLDYPRTTMRRDLEILGFAESMVFPDLVGLSKEITASEGLR